jgi:mannose-6-phosphate isomerase-like protein (cupin superfamily)
MTEPTHMQTKQTPEKMDVRAPDASEIRLLLNGERGGMCHCTLQAGNTSIAGVHKTVEEIWYCLQGQGQMWRKEGKNTSIVDISPGVCLTIPTHTQFQFRNTGTVPLCVIITTMPPWPGPEEWIEVAGYWQS